jgi:excisionase family DNA binding protein
MGKTAEGLPVLRSIGQTAEHLGVSIKTVRRWVASGDLPSYRLGRSIRIAEPDLLNFIKLRRAT